jgi:hypothetical protein
MKLRIFLGLLFFAICLLALGRIMVQTVRRPLVPAARPAGLTPQFATRHA